MCSSIEAVASRQIRFTLSSRNVATPETSRVLPNVAAPPIEEVVLADKSDSATTLSLNVATPATSSAS